MGFKTKKISQKGIHKFSYFVGIISIFIVFGVGAFFLNAIGQINFSLSGDFNIPQIIENIGGKNDKTRINKAKTNILVIGRGGGNHDAPDLTDTIILVSIDTQKETISMLSIPRDLYVNYNNGSGRINEIYRNFSTKYSSKKLGMQALENKITEITGENIDYYLDIDFEGFTKIIDTFDGIEITLEENFIDEQYPNGSGGYQTFILKKGTWTLDGDAALKYARSRHSTSDFDRSLRQQQIIEGLKNKIIENGLLKNTSKIKKLYGVFTQYVQTDLNLENILKLAKIAKSDYKIISSNLNDSCFYGTHNCIKGGFLYIPNRELFGNASVLLIEGTNIGNLSNYSEVEKYFDIIFNHTEIFKENYQIKVYNGIQENFLASVTADNIKKYGFNIPERKSVGNTNKTYDKSIVYYNNIEEESKTIEILKSFTTADFIASENPIYSDENTKIEIILGKDYKTAFNF